MIQKKIQKIFMVVVVLIAAVFGYQYFQKNDATITTVINAVSDLTSADDAKLIHNTDNFDDIKPTYNEALPTQTIVVTAPNATTSNYRCDGRQHCSQMTSCAEATYFIQHCPNTKMDGNGDGVPCEKQWCK